MSRTYSQHNDGFINAEPDCILVITITNGLWSRRYFGRWRVPVLLHSRSSMWLAPLLGSQDQLHILPCCQPCPREVGWEGEVVLHHEGSEHHRAFIHTDWCLGRRELMPVQHMKLKTKKSGEKSLIDSTFLCGYLVCDFSEIYSD